MEHAVGGVAGLVPIVAMATRGCRNPGGVVSQIDVNLSSNLPPYPAKENLGIDLNAAFCRLGEQISILECGLLAWSILPTSFPL